MIQDIRRHIKQLIQEMSKGAYEREEVIALSLLSAFAGRVSSSLDCRVWARVWWPAGSRAHSGTAPALST